VKPPAFLGNGKSSVSRFAEQALVSKAGGRSVNAAESLADFFIYFSIGQK
jgi:hypothetical protein